MIDVDELDMHLSHKLARELDPDLWAEEMMYDAQKYLAETENDEE